MVLCSSEKRFNRSISQFITSTCEAVITTTERARRARSLLRPQLQFIQPKGNISQGVAGLINQRQPLFTCARAMQQGMSDPLLKRTNQLPHGGWRDAQFASRAGKLPCRAVASKACSHFNRLSERIPVS